MKMEGGKYKQLLNASGGDADGEQHQDYEKVRLTALENRTARTLLAEAEGAEEEEDDEVAAKDIDIPASRLWAFQKPELAWLGIGVVGSIMAGITMPGFALGVRPRPTVHSSLAASLQMRGIPFFHLANDGGVLLTRLTRARTFSSRVSSPSSTRRTMTSSRTASWCGSSSSYSSPSSRLCPPSSRHGPSASWASSSPPACASSPSPAPSARTRGTSTSPPTPQGP
mmetsp:Transcript_46568/g.149542  ORF Transcript_46568/g.149542 Transcript_46568/m.149542 type:complete len:226 (-) Transcript_46568:1049-1726(-)